MALTLTMADLADITPYEGENLSASWTDTERDEVGLQAQAYLCVLLKYDAVTNWATMNAVYKIILTEYVARSVAMAGIAFNLSTVGATFSSLIEPEDMIQLHIYRLENIEKLIRESDKNDFIRTT